MGVVMTADCVTNSLVLRPEVATAAFYRALNAGFSPANHTEANGVRFSCVCPANVFDIIVRHAHDDVALSAADSELQQAATVATGGAL